VVGVPGCTTDNEVPRFIRVSEGDPITTMPLCLCLDQSKMINEQIYSSVECVRGNAHNRLVNAILGINLDQTLQELSIHDPLSWHCTSRSAQQTWLLHQKRETDNETNLPHPERPQSPRTKRPEYQGDDSESGVHVVQRAKREFHITINTLSWPPIRRIYTTDQERQCVDMPPPPRTALRWDIPLHPHDTMLPEIHIVR
jgi:hypothetical protein